MKQTINHQKFYKNVLSTPHELTILLDVGKLARNTEVLLGELSYISFRVYGHTSDFLNLLPNVELAGDIETDEPETYKNVDFTVTNNQDVAIRAQLSGSVIVGDINEAVIASQTLHLDNLLRVTQYENACASLNKGV